MSQCAFGGGGSAAQRCLEMISPFSARTVVRKAGQVFRTGTPWRDPRTTLDRHMAFLQSVPPRQPFFRAPAVVLWLIGILAVLHLARVTRPGDQPEEAVYAFGLYPLRYSRT